jgi:hypothetical protein
LTGEGRVVDGAELFAGLLGHLGLDGLEAVRPGLADLRADVVGLGDVEVVGRPRISHAELVERADPVSHPLTRDEDRAADVKAERVVLEGRAVPVAHQEADQPLVGLVHLVLVAREGNAGAVHDREIAGHHAVEPHETVVEDADRVLGDHFGRRGHRDAESSAEGGRNGGKPPPREQQRLPTSSSVQCCRVDHGSPKLRRLSPGAVRERPEGRSRRREHAKRTGRDGRATCRPPCAFGGRPIGGFGAELLLHTPLNEVLVDDQLEHTSRLLAESFQTGYLNRFIHRKG